jgi:hypothetical protein
VVFGIEIGSKAYYFCRGFWDACNPYFKNLPLDGTKGELFIKAPELNLDVIVNVFYITIGWRLVQSGATYNWKDKTNLVTEDGKQELIDRIKIINCDFTIMEHFAGVRPTVKDRRPLVGTHAEYSAIHILNGLPAG